MNTKNDPLNAVNQAQTVPFKIPSDLQHSYTYAQQCMSEDEPFGYGPTKVVQLIERVARAEATVAELTEAGNEILMWFDAMDYSRLLGPTEFREAHTRATGKNPDPRKEEK